MYCQQPEYYQMPTDYQAYVGSGLPYQGINMPNYPPSDISLYSPNSPADRPSPSFRIEDIIHNNKTCSGNPYANMYPSNHYPPFAADSLQHGGVLNKDYQGMFLSIRLFFIVCFLRFFLFLQPWYFNLLYETSVKEYPVLIQICRDKC